MTDRTTTTRLLRTSLLIAAAFGVAATTAARAQTPAAPPAPADIVFVNGKVFTSDDGDHVVQGFAITGDRFVAAGTDSDVRRYVDRKPK